MDLIPVCPRCRDALTAGTTSLMCRDCGSTYPIVRGVPVVLPQSLTDQQLSQRSYFDAEFSSYGVYKPENWRLSFVHRIVRALRIPESGPYLDVGVGGSGATVIEAARLGADAVGCDLSVEGVVHASTLSEAEGVGERARFVACAAEFLPFRDGSFGCASAVAVLEHLDDDERAARELHRVLRPGGLLWITVPNAYRYIPPPLWPVYALHDRRLGHKRHYDIARLGRLMSAAGFRARSTFFSGHPVKLLQLAIDRLVPLRPERREATWWKLERLDLRAERRALGALQLSAVFEKPVLTR